MISRNVEEILQKADAVEHLEILEEENKLHEDVKDLNASIAAAERRGNREAAESLQKDLGDLRKKLNKWPL